MTRSEFWILISTIWVAAAAIVNAHGTAPLVMGLLAGVASLVFHYADRDTEDE